MEKEARINVSRCWMTKILVYRWNRQHNPPFLATGIFHRSISHRHQGLPRVPARVDRKKRVEKSPLGASFDRHRGCTLEGLTNCIRWPRLLIWWKSDVVRSSNKQKKRRRAEWDAQNNIMRCRSHFRDESIASEEHLLVCAFCASHSRCKPVGGSGRVERLRRC